jgi:hypothetical protein
MLLHVLKIEFNYGSSSFFKNYFKGETVVQEQKSISTTRGYK